MQNAATLCGMTFKEIIPSVAKPRARLIGGTVACLALIGVVFNAFHWLQGWDDRDPVDIPVKTNAPSLTAHTDESISALAHEIYVSHKLAPTIINVGRTKMRLYADENDEPRKAIAALVRQHSPRAEEAIAGLREGDLNLAIALFAELAEKAETTNPTSVKEAAEFYSNLGALAAFDNNEKATQAYTKALKLDPQMADAWNQLGRLQLWTGDLTAAEKSYGQILALGDHFHDQTSVGRALSNLGTIAQARGKSDRAEDFFKRALAINEALGQREEVSNNLLSLGITAEERRDFGEAETFYKKALAINETLGRKQAMAATLDNLGKLARERNKLDAAENYTKRSLIIYEALGDEVQTAVCFTILGAITFDRGDTPKAREFWTRARDLYSQNGNKDMVAAFDNWLAAPEYQ